MVRRSSSAASCRAPPGNAVRTGGRSMPNGSLGGWTLPPPPPCTGVISYALPQAVSSKPGRSQPSGCTRASNHSSGRAAGPSGSATGVHASPRTERHERSVTTHSSPISASKANEPTPSE